MKTIQTKIRGVHRAASFVALTLLRALYSFVKLLPHGGQITVLSRQCDEKTADLKLLEDELRNRNLSFQILTKRIPSSMLGKVRYLPHIVRQLLAVARSRVLIIDGYSIVASALNHKDRLRIIQIWHGSGAFKRFGRSAIGVANGPNPELSRMFRIHANYDFVLCSGTKASPPFSEAFGVEPTRVLTYPLPHFDLLGESSRLETSKSIYREFSDLRNQKVVLWAPTRLLVGEIDPPSQNSLTPASEKSGFKLIKSTENCHTNSLSLASTSYAKFSTLQWLSVSVGLITDQSSMIFEAMFAGLPFVIYVASGNKEKLYSASYLESDIWSSFITDDADEAFSMISSKEYISKCHTLRRDYISSPRGHSYSEDLVDLIEQVRSGIRT